MLSLTRGTNESIIIETSTQTILITITAIKGKQVKLSFDAPDDVDIWREEIYQQLEDDNNSLSV